ncbi:GNAT family N-acetyltransferase [Haloterrigena sp. SYSU A121-1]|uniref:GNAT family N-acetyltransferase n=1 Tax=Haloterrigena gelatinilytica TaxID=2741724 RepID=A0A8J8KGK6_9EURY|nr:GNAT family N-acetyltransferase [Haloterrigena gelatinilytica]NUB92636.1 GNAT family N-acetyltransferase [Haloterrigena gelatinilytica]
MSALRVRRFEPADADLIRELHETAMRDVGAYVADVPDEDLETVTETYFESGGEFLVGEREGRIVAMGAFRPVDGTDFVAQVLPDLPESTVELTRMRVDPGYQRRGYGRRVATELERRARERGATQIVLDTRPTQTAARGLYETLGYEEAARERIEGFGEPFELVFYRKSILDGE